MAPAAVSHLRGRGQWQIGAARDLPERRVVLSLVLYIAAARSGARPPSRGTDASLLILLVSFPGRYFDRSTYRSAASAQTGPLARLLNELSYVYCYFGCSSTLTPSLSTILTLNSGMCTKKRTWISSMHFLSNSRPCCSLMPGVHSRSKIDRTKDDT